MHHAWDGISEIPFHCKRWIYRSSGLRFRRQDQKGARNHLVTITHITHGTEHSGSITFVNIAEEFRWTFVCRAAHTHAQGTRRRTEDRLMREWATTTYTNYINFRIECNGKRLHHAFNMSHTTYYITLFSCHSHFAGIHVLVWPKVFLPFSPILQFYSHISHRNESYVFCANFSPIVFHVDQRIHTRMSHLGNRFKRNTKLKQTYSDGKWKWLLYLSAHAGAAKRKHTHTHSRIPHLHLLESTDTHTHQTHIILVHVWWWHHELRGM